MKYVCDNKRHLICIPYSIENLHRMAEDLSIKRCWFHRGKMPHYDIPKKRVDEIMRKAHVASTRFIVETIRDSLND